MAKKKLLKLKPVKGHMYSEVYATWNPLKGSCFHCCPYCYVLKMSAKKQRPIHVDADAYRVDLESGHTIMICSGCDLFAEDIPNELIKRTLDYADKFDNTYWLQSKNPARMLDFVDHPVIKKAVLLTTIETNRDHKEFMGKAPSVVARADAMAKLHELGLRTMVTVEPMMAFDRTALVGLIRKCSPEQVNLGVNTNTHISLPEPEKVDVLKLINELRGFTNVVVKDNLKNWLSKH